MNKRVIRYIGVGLAIIAVFAAIFAFSSGGDIARKWGDGALTGELNNTVAYAAGNQDIYATTLEFHAPWDGANTDSAWHNEKYAEAPTKISSEPYVIPDELRTGIASGRVGVTVEVNAVFGYVTGPSGRFRCSKHESSINVVGVERWDGNPGEATNKRFVATKGQLTKDITSIVIELTDKVGVSLSPKPASGKKARAEARIDGTARITFQFLRPTVTIESADTAIGTVSNSGTHNLGYVNTITSTATPKANNYFTGWTLDRNVKTFAATITTPRGNAYTRDNQYGSYNPNTPSLKYSAGFAAITGDWSTGPYTYNGSQQGPRADDSRVANVTTTHKYEGINGTSYLVSTNRPTEAGNYRYTVTMSGSGSGSGNTAANANLGSRTVTFVINKANLESVFTSPQPIYLGQSIKESGVNASQPINTHSRATVDGSWVWSSSADEKWQLNQNSLLPIGGNDTNANEGTVTLVYTFVPNNKVSFESYSRSFTFTVKKGFKVSKLNVGENNINNAFSFVSRVDRDTNTAQVVLTATPSQAHNFAFFGWQAGGRFDDATLSNQNYDALGANNGVGTAIYSMGKNADGTGKVSDYEKELTAVFIKYFTDDPTGSTSQISRDYTGATQALIIKFLDEVTWNGKYAKAATLYSTSDSAAPKKVGVYTVSFVLNRKLEGGGEKQIATCKLTLTIKARDINVTVDKSSVGYNDTTHWARQTVYSLSTEGVIAGGITKYWYSTDNQNTWTEIAVTPDNARGCKILFNAPVSSNGSNTKQYWFRAVNGDSDLPQNAAVASSNTAVECRTDAIVPTITVALGNSHINGVWTNKDVVFSFTITTGGSGAILEYSNNIGTSWADTQIIAFNNEYRDLTAAESRTVSFTLTEEQVKGYSFRITGGSGNITNFNGDTGSNLYIYNIKIDKQAPIVTKVAINKTPNINGWINEEVKLTFTATDNNALHENSGIISIVANNGAIFTYVGGGTLNPASNTCLLTVPDCRRYTITVRDEATNETVLEVQENVDTITPTYTLVNNSYVSDSWINHDAVFNFSVSAGGSGIRLSYSLDGANYAYFEKNNAFIKQPGQESNHLQTVDLTYRFTAEQLQRYHFKVESGAGKETIVDFGNVKIDLTKPIFYNHENAAIVANLDYNNDKTKWTVDTQNLVLSVKDDIHTVFNSGIARVVLNDGGSASTALTSINNIYTVSITKCTLYTVTVTDEAGNSVQYTYKLKVDQGTLNTTLQSANIGTTNVTYDFSPTSWLSFVKNKEDAFVAFTFDITFSPSGVKLEYSTNNNNWIDITKESADGSYVFKNGYMFEKDKETELTQHLVYKFDVKDEQNNKFYLRMSSGSGQEVVFGDKEGWYIRIDQTAPSISNQVFYRNGATELISPNDLTNIWRPYAVKTEYTLVESFSGIATNVVVAYDYNAVIPYPINLNSLGSGTLITPTITGTSPNQTYSFVMDAYKKYVFVVVDNAGNIRSKKIDDSNYAHTDILPLIDSTSGFTFTVDTTNTNGNTPYASGAWLFNTLDQVRFDFNIALNNGATHFGASGGMLQFSINGSNWTTTTTINTITQEIMENGSITTVYSDKLHPYMVATVPQVKDYKFRVITGAGVIYEYASAISVRKDTTAPAVAVEMSVHDKPYASAWVDAPVVLNLKLDVGPSGATLYMAVSAKANAGASELTFLKLQNYNEGSFKYTHEITSTSQNGAYYYYFKVEDGTKGVRSAFVSSTPSIVKIDRDAVAATNKAYVKNTEYITNSTNIIWTANDVVFKLENILVGPSGYTVTYQTSAINANNWGVEQSAGYDTASNTLTIAANCQLDYQFIVTNGSGKKHITNARTIYIDKVAPEFSLANNDTGTQRIKTAGSANFGWWIVNPIYNYLVGATGESGYTMQYASSDDGKVWRPWTSDGISKSAITVSDTSGAGGTTAYYKFRLISGAGVSSVVRSAEGAEHSDATPIAIKIDTHTYSVSNLQYVGAVNGINYASVSGGGSNVFKRGDNVNITITTNNNYTIKSLAINVDYAKKGAITDNNTKIGYSVEIQGQNVVGTLQCVKSVTVIYSGLAQHLQGRTIAAVTLTVDEENFDKVFGALQYGVTYNNNPAIPTAVGQYTVAAAAVSDDFIIKNATTNLTVIYFAGSGDGNSPYKISSYADIQYINMYMSSDGSFDYLGAERKTGQFTQTNDIELPKDFTPITVFSGAYNGNGYKVYCNEVIDIATSSSQDFGFIRNLSGNLEQLVVQLNLRANNYTGNIGLVAGSITAPTVATQSMASINNCVAIGSISLNACATGIAVGGVVGLTDNAGVFSAFSDVTITATNGCQNCYIGGVVGKSNNQLVLFAAYAVGNISRSAKTASPTFRTGALVGFVAGTYVNSITEEGSAPIVIPSYFMINNITINGETREAIVGDYGKVAIGNQGSVSGINNAIVGIDIYDKLLTDTTVIISRTADKIVQYSLTVGELAQYKFRLLGLIGSGIASDPLQIAKQSDLDSLAIFPWAHFLQTKDIVMTGDNMSAFSSSSVFRGVYDGGYEGNKSHSISNFSLSQCGFETGLFAKTSGIIRNLEVKNINYNVKDNSQSIYVGGVVGILQKGGALQNVVVSGNIKVEAGDTYSYVGGAVGYASGATISDITSVVTLNVKTRYITIGGVIGQADGDDNKLNNLFNFSKTTAEYDRSAYVGAIIGSVIGVVSGSDFYSVAGSAYANGRVILHEISALSDTSAITKIATLSYEEMLKKVNVKLPNIGSLYPFDSGDGTLLKPFIVSTYKQLLQIGNYMYASFELANDIIIGDLDNDKVVDSDYKYDFKPIGEGGVFTGRLNGKNHAISNVTDALFTINDGNITDLALHVYYNVYSDVELLNKDINKNMAKLADGNDIVFGGLAKYNRSNAYVKGLVVDGSIYIRVNGRVRVKVGGVVGVAYGGEIKATITSANINIGAVACDVGGIVGSVEGSALLEYSTNLADLGYNIVVQNLYASGAVVNAGMIVGAIRNKDAVVTISEMPSANLFVNGANIGDKHPIGWQIK